MKGYQVKQYNEPVKRYCQTLELRDNPELIAEYRRRHSREKAWPEIRQGIREVGILEMEIYILGTKLFTGMGRLYVCVPEGRPRCVFGGKVATDGENVLPL